MFQTDQVVLTRSATLKAIQDAITKIPADNGIRTQVWAAAQRLHQEGLEAVGNGQSFKQDLPIVDGEQYYLVCARYRPTILQWLTGRARLRARRIKSR